MIAKKNKPAQTGSGSRTLTYVLVGALVLLVGYYIVLPSFTPRTTGVVTTGSAPAYTLSLSPNTDIAGTQVTITAQGLTNSTKVSVMSVMFGSTSVPLTNSTSGSGYCRTGTGGSFNGCTFWVPAKTPSGTYNVTLTLGPSTAVAKFTVPQYTPPVSTMLVTLTSIALSVITQVVTRRVVDLNKERRMRAEVNAFNKEKREATLANDKVKLEKLKKRELAVRQEQAKVSTARLKVTAVTFVPLLVVYYLMASLLGGYGVMVAFSPISIPVITAPTLVPGTYELSLFWWYFLSSFTFSIPLTRLFHTNP